jgi:long-chain fatty acid transport protein
MSSSQTIQRMGLSPRHLVLATLSALLWFAGSGSAEAGGLYFPVWGTPSAGVAGAGANARANDASTALSNPAGMTRLDDHQLMLGAAPGIGNVRFDPDSGSPAGEADGGQQGGFLPVVSSFYAHKLSDRFRLGFGLASISGAALDPKTGWAGRNQMNTINLFTLSMLPSVAYRISDQLSIGVGAALTYARLNWKLSAPVATEPRVKLDEMDDFAAAPFAGILYEPSDRVRFGITYQGKTDLELSGNASIGGGGAATAEFDLDLPLAQAVRGSAVWQLDDLVALFFSLRWEDWSELDTTAVSLNGNTEVVTLGFKDTWGGGIGLEIYPTDDWTFQTGMSFDSSALDDSDRTVALPVDDTIRFAVGVLHDYSENTQLGLAFNYMNLGDGNVDQATVSGSYSDNELFLFALSANFSKLPWAGRGQY